MERLIYYPGFEVQEPDWLKFALLYMDKLCPIIPQTGDRELSNLYHQLLSETDLIDIHRPQYGEGTRATLDAIEAVEKILQHPMRYFPVFRNTDVVSKWKDTESHNYTLYAEKYSDAWRGFCINEGLAQPSDEGLRMHKDLALIYMTILSQAIADGEGVSPITDYQGLDRLSIFIRKVPKREADRINAMKSVVQLKLPGDLKRVTFQEIIALRNERDFALKRKAFHTEFDKFFNSAESDNISEDFIHSFPSAWNDFSDEMVRLGVGVTTIGLGIWILSINNPTAIAPYLRELAGAAAITVGSIVGIRNAWTNTATKRNCRKYLATLNRLQRRHIPR
jgi:hypothetical protein